MMKIIGTIYNLVLYNRPIKKMAGSLLSQNWFADNPIYNNLYNKHLKKKMALFSSQPFRVMVENTNLCNSNCVFCPHGKMQRKTGVMNMNLFRKIVDECADLGIDYFTVYGFGEPLLDPSFVEKIKYAKNKGLKRVTTNTNVSLLTPEKSRQLIEAGLDEIYISFDAATKETYSKIRRNLNFDVAEENISLLCSLRNKLGVKKPEIILSFVESSDNKHEVKKYINKWKDKVDNISISIIHNWTGDIGDKSVGENIKRDPCRLLWTDMVVSWDGIVPLCCNDYENKMVLGDINDQNILEIWGGSRLRVIREQHKRGAFCSIPICKNCQYNYHHKSPWWVSK